jgi:hypothetical protein
MANFCIGCGSPLGAQSGFCGHCGARIVPAPLPPVPTLAAAPVTAKSRGGAASGLKIVLFVLGVLFVVGAIGVAGMYYTARRYVRLAENVTGVKVGDVVSSINQAANHPAQTAPEGVRNGCSLWSKEEASAALGIEVERVDGKPDGQVTGEHCNYFVKPGTIEQNAEKLKQATEAVQSAPDSGSKPPEALNDLIKTAGRSMSEAAGNGVVPYFSFTVERENGKLTLTAFKLADRLGGAAASEPPAVGDEAAMGMADSRLCAVKGNSSLTLDLSQVTGGRAKGIDIARTILARM